MYCFFFFSLSLIFIIENFQISNIQIQYRNWIVLSELSQVPHPLLEIEPRAFDMLGKCCTDLDPQDPCYFLF